MRADQQHKGCKYPNGNACDLTFRLTGATGEDVEEGFEKFKESVDSKIMEHKTTPQTPRGLTKAVKRASSGPGFKKPKMPRRSASVMCMGMTSPLARVAPPSAPSYTTSKTSSTNRTGKATGESASMSSIPKPVEMPLGEQPTPDKGHTTAEDVSASSQSTASSETEDGQLDSDDQLSFSVGPAETLEANKMCAPCPRAAVQVPQVPKQKLSANNTLPLVVLSTSTGNNTADSTRRVVVDDTPSGTCTITCSVPVNGLSSMTSNVTDVKLAGWSDAQSGRVVLDVGGRRFATSKATLRCDPGSLLSAMVLSGSVMHPWRVDEVNCPIYFLDRDPAQFRHILNYLRLGNSWSAHSLPKELRYLYDLKA